MLVFLMYETALLECWCYLTDGGGKLSHGHSLFFYCPFHVHLPLIYIYVYTGSKRISEDHIEPQNCTAFHNGTLHGLQLTSDTSRIMQYVFQSVVSVFVTNLH